VFRRALERGNALVAEMTARELGHISLREALELTALVARHDRVRGSRLAARWLERWLGDSPAPMIDDAVIVAANLAALGGGGHDAAVSALRASAARVSGKAGPPRRR
jgi:hypothetical protein